MAKKRIMRSFRLSEISVVDHPAQKGAKMTIMKRAAPALSRLQRRLEQVAKRVERIAKKIPVGASVSDYIHDFVNSSDPRFKGKSKEERIRMALGAAYAHGAVNKADWDESKHPRKPSGSEAGGEFTSGGGGGGEGGESLKGMLDRLNSKVKGEGKIHDKGGKFIFEPNWDSDWTGFDAYTLKEVEAKLKGKKPPTPGY